MDIDLPHRTCGGSCSCAASCDQRQNWQPESNVPQQVAMEPAGRIELHHAGVRNRQIASRRDTGHLQDVQEHSGCKVCFVYMLLTWLLT